MPLTSGSRLGPYLIVSPLGAGGMGEVYRAKDTRLDRTVAIKVLPSHLSQDPETRQRFEREARAISALQHPHICTLHDIGQQDGVDFLVMEHLEGLTLADKLGKGPMPMPQALAIAVELAEALECAHRQGIVHRDLKPANIMLTKAGVKLMDFGLAKPELAVAGAGSAQTQGPFTPSSPTVVVGGGFGSGSLAGTMISGPSQLTQKGMFVGTCQYMAPEVLQGAPADARSDIFSFGCVLYEMVAGRRAFEAKTQIGVLSAILEKEPEPIRAVQPLVSPMLEKVIGGCLAKEPADRFQSVHDVGMDLQWLRDATSDGPAKSEAAGPGRKWLAGLAAVCLALVTLAGVLGYWWATHSIEAAPLHAEIAPPDDYLIDSTGDHGGMPVLSPQGDKIAFVAHSPTTKTLWVRLLASEKAQQLDGTQGAMHPFWSPDGKFIAFFANNKLNKIAATGGSIVPLADVTNPRGGTWSKDGIILYTPNILDGLMQVNANGGTPVAVTALSSTKADTHRWPWFMPDGRHFVFLSVSHTATSEKQGIYFGSLDSKDVHLVVETNAGAQFASGRLLYHLNSDLVAQPFDSVAGTLSGAPVTLVSNVRNDLGVWRTVFSTSQNGFLLYQSGSNAAAGTRVALVDRAGKELSQISSRANSAIDVRLSPDGKRLALAEADGIWIEDIERKTRNRITYGASLGEEPSWSADGKSLIFATGLRLVGAASGTDSEIRSVPADGSGKETVLAKVNNGAPMPNWSADGKYLVYMASSGPNTSVVWAVPVAGNAAARVVIEPPTEKAVVWDFRISNDSHWIAYQSDESGVSALYIARFPEGTGKWRVSTDTAAYPAWSANDKELFYKDFNDDFWVCPVHANGTEMEVGTPQMLFHANQPGLGIPFDVMPDGKTLLVNLAEDEVKTPLKLTTNWLAELPR